MKEIEELKRVLKPSRSREYVHTQEEMSTCS